MQTISYYAQYKHTIDGFIKSSNTPCTVLSSTNITCTIPTTINKNGYYILYLTDQTGNSILSDNHLIRILILSKPILNAVATSPLYSGISSLNKKFITIGLSSPLTDFNVLTSTLCQFGGNSLIKASTAIWLSTDKILCEISAKNYVTSGLCVEVSFNYGYDYTSACTSQVKIIRSERVLQISPIFASIERYSNTIISISGSQFSVNIDYYCIMKNGQEYDFAQKADYTSASLITCKMQRSKYNATYQASFQIYADSALLYTTAFYMLSDSVVLSMSPDYGPSIGQTKIIITFKESLNLIANIQRKCRISSNYNGNAVSGTVVEVIASPISDTSVSCVIPDMSSKLNFGSPAVSTIIYYISILQYDLQYKNGILMYRFYQNPVLTALTPNKGYMDYSNIVKITGSGFQSFKDLSAVMIFPNNLGSKTISTVAFIDANTLIITIPDSVILAKNSKIDQVTFEISLNGVDYTNSGTLVYSYISTPSITGLFPNSGSKFGQTAVSIIGNNFNSDIKYCIFGELYNKVPGNYVSNTQITCVSPIPLSNSVTQVQVKLEFAGGIIIEKNLLNFIYSDMKIITSISPSEYHISGGVNCILSGSFAGLKSLPSWSVSFGNMLSPKVNLIDDSTISAQIPPSAISQYTSISIVVTSALIYTNEFIQFHYMDYGILTVIQPNHGPSEGNYAISMKGTGFLPSVTVSCVFTWPATASSNSQQKITSGAYISDNLILCMIPSHILGTTATLELQFNSLYTTSSKLTFAFEADIEISSIDIHFSPLEGNSKITLFGRNFLSGSYLMVGIQAVAINAISSSQAEIISPAQVLYGKYNLRVSTNGMLYKMIYNIMSKEKNIVFS